MLIVDVSASGNFGSTSQQSASWPRKLPAFSLSAPSGITIKLACFSQRSPRTFHRTEEGRSHTLRIIREILFFGSPQRDIGRGQPCHLHQDRDPSVVRVVFFISPTFKRTIFRAHSRHSQTHDLIAIRIQGRSESILLISDYYAGRCRNGRSN